MRRQNLEQSAFDVATQVRTVEDTIENALIEIAELQSRMLRARAVAGVGTATGHDALEQLAASLNALVVARGGVANCHAALRAATQQVPGLRTTAFGDTRECPEPSSPSGFLRAVA